MKKLLGLMACLCVGIVLTMGSTGCTTKDAKDNKAKAKGKDGDTTSKDKDKKIDVAVEKEVKLEAGKSGKAKITLTRGKEAKKVAKVTAKVDKEGVTASAEDIKGDSSEGFLMIETTDKTKAGDYIITLLFKSEDSPDPDAVKVTAKVSAKGDAVVPTKDTKLEIADGKATTVKQGAKGTSKVAVTVGADLKGVKLSVEVKGPKDGKGVKAELDPEKLDKSGDATANITVADDATVGEWTVTITAAGEGATPATAASKTTVTVEKKGK
jgi:ATP-dependent Clp protease adapter protein ClpS